MITGINDYLNQRGLTSIGQLVGGALPRLGDWNDLNLAFRSVARIDPAKCVGCNLCYVACDDGGHQCIDRVHGQIAPVVREQDCVGCNLCALVCPEPGCIDMVRVDDGTVERTWRSGAIG